MRRALLLLLVLPALAQAQIAFRGASSGFNEGLGVQHSSLGTVASGSGATVTPGLPARVAGDLLLTIIEVGDDNAFSMSASWTLLFSGAQSTNHQAAIYWRIATNTAADTATISHAGPGGRNVLLARVVAFSNVDPANPFDGLSFNPSAGNDNAVDTGAINVTNACSLRVATVHINDNDSITSPPAGWYQSFYNSTGTGNDAAISLWYETVTAAGVQPSVNIQYSANDRSHAAQFALRPQGLTLNVPGGTQAGDVMVATIATRPGNSNPANQNAKKVCEPTGWTLVRDTTNNAGGATGGTGMRLQTYMRVATGAEPASYTWYAQLNNPSVVPATVFVSGVGGIVAYSGVDNTTPLDVEGGNTTGNSYSHTGNSLTTTVANTMLVASHSFLSADTWTPPAGMTERVDQSAPPAPPDNAVGVALEMSEEARPAAGATGNKTAVASGGSGTDSGIVHMLALRPAPPSTPGGFNAFETSTAAGAITGVIRTKVGGVAASIDIVALNPARTAVFTTFTGTVRVDILNSGDNSGALDPTTGCRSSWTVIQTLTPDPVFLGGELGRKTIGFTVPNVYREARVRVSFPAASPAVSGCSTDNFAIRPASFSLAATDSDWQAAGTGRALANTGAAGGNVHKAGRPFTLTVTPAPVTATSYNGDPTVSALACSLPAPCANGALTVGAFSGAGTRTSTTASYSEAGAFNLTLVDQTFAAVDAADGTPADCSASGRYVCQSPAPLAVGRFVPDRFAVTPVTSPVFRTFDALDADCSVPPAGAQRSFTYIGQPFGYATAPSATVLAQNAAGATTTNYRGVLWKLNAASVSQTVANAPVLPLDTSQMSTPTLTQIPNTGTGALNASAGDKLAFTRDTAAPSAPFSASLSITWSVSDAAEAGANQGTISTTTPPVFNGVGAGIAFDSGAGFRYGRLRLGTTHGSQLVALPVTMETQYWSGAAGFVTNAADHCTSIDAANVAMAGFSGNLAACETALGGGGALTGGRRALILAAPGNGNDGAVRLTVNLGAAAAGTTCTVVGGAATPATAADRAYLQGNWTGAAYDDDPSARTTFGTFKGTGEVIYIRENF